jgi:hypothetical protein
LQGSRLVTLAPRRFPDWPSHFGNKLIALGLVAADETGLEAARPVNVS